MADGSPSKQEKPGLPPYIAFQSLKTMAGHFKEHAVPDRIDRSVLTNFSGAVGAQIITSLRFLGLIDAHGHPTPGFRELVDHHGTDKWPTTLGKTLRSAYAPIFELNLATCSPSQFISRFKDTYDGADEVIRKSITFFLNAARDAEIPLSAFLLKARKPRSAPSKKRKPAREQTQTGDVDDDDPIPTRTASEPSQVLLDLLDPAEMDEGEQEAVWTLLKFLKKKSD
jgi:hypothetical protein